ncbi:MAG TPA: hypothetical protein VJR25_11180 [Microbacterium sp.]|uniref:hypothetical protein n=1 Tax=Microbacterium sp. TaxID=51671 RepID=UPI002B48C3C0|nr:hypothetical protein [Microbacterium sp.]HKT57324.1 hypothetical protein [Microbacterium sp.]
MQHGQSSFVRGIWGDDVSERRLLGRLALVGVSAAALTACAVAMMAGAASAGPSRPLAVPEILVHPAAPHDPAPGREQLEQAGIEPQTARYAGADAQGSYWLATDRSSGVCLVAQTRGEGSASACVSRATFAARGISLGLTGSTPDERREVYAIPDDVDAELVAQRAGLHVVSANVLTGGGAHSGGQEFRFASTGKTGGATFRFRTLPIG